MVAMDIPQVLAKLRWGQDWGPCAQSDSTYADLARTWRGADPVPSEQEMLDAWDEIQSALVVPPTITRRQFFQYFATVASPPPITTDEAEIAAGGGTLPATLLNAIANLPTEQQFPARMLLRVEQEFHRNHPLVAGLGTILGYASADLDTAWILAARL